MILLYLKVLDVLELLGSAPVDNDNPVEVIRRYVEDRNLDITRLKEYAKYYNEDVTTILEKIGVLMNLHKDC